MLQSPSQIARLMREWKRIPESPIVAMAGQNLSFHKPAWTFQRVPNGFKGCQLTIPQGLFGTPWKVLVQALFFASERMHVKMPPKLFTKSFSVSKPVINHCGTPLGVPSYPIKETSPRWVHLWGHPGYSGAKSEVSGWGPHWWPSTPKSPFYWLNYGKNIHQLIWVFP